MYNAIFGGGLPPALIFIFGSLLIPLLPGKAKRAWMLFLPVASFAVVLNTPEGIHWTVRLMDFDLIFGRVDRLARPFGMIFSIVSFLGVIYSLHVKDDLQNVSGFMYAGGALGVTFAGDLFSLYIFWEVMAIASTFLVLARKTREAYGAAYRYVLVHIFGGLALLAGIVFYIHTNGTTEFANIGLDGSAASWLIFLGVAVNAAVLPFHPWLKDAYPAATETGAVFLSAFTTKSAVYVMARMFPGTELLIYLGALMAAVPIFYAVLENDLRRVLAYSLINQVGFMMVGVGIGTALSINGTVAHAFCHILYKALLFMSAGAVLYRTGTIRCTALGGLYKTMPFTCLFCVIGAASISAFPLFSGFVSKSMIVSAAGHHKLVVVWLLLQFASAGVFHHAGIKVPFFIFFGHDSGLRPKEAPWNMQIAMFCAAFLCVFIGCFPQPLYTYLPFPVDYVPYTGAHVVGQLQLLMFGALAFCLLVLSGYYPAEMRATHLDTDWFYRKGGKWFYRLMDRMLNGINKAADKLFVGTVTAAVNRFMQVAPTRISTWISRPFLGEKAEKEIDAAYRTGTTPVGLSAAACVLAIAIFYFFC